MHNHPEKHTIKIFRELLRRFERELFVQNNESCCTGITLAQCHVLLEIESRGKESLSELAGNIGLDKSTISRTVDGLVNIGLVDRSVTSEDRRMATLQLTEAGKKICSTINKTSDEYYEDTLSVLNEVETEEIILLLNKLINRMTELRQRPGSSCKI
ncbi:MAG TPA: MarR family winged helix-turn-helix transcriptional regulator [Bacteroidales bacterium]|nr:MarR family winged helix-turn-helix transcriptional regulator [Bacteroidales bacterium]